MKRLKWTENSNRSRLEAQDGDYALHVFFTSYLWSWKVTHNGTIVAMDRGHRLIGNSDSAQRAALRALRKLQAQEGKHA